MTPDQHLAREDDDTCPDGDCDMRVCDDSFDHAFGVHRIPMYLQCSVCNRTEAMS